MADFKANDPSIAEKHIADDVDSDRPGILDVQLDRAKEIKLLAKLDLAFMPVIMLVYLTCFLDRSNIGGWPTSLQSPFAQPSTGNVKVAGMPKDIGATTQQVW